MEKQLVDEKVLAELREGRDLYRTITETASDAIVTIDENSTILLVNPAAEKIFGHRVADMQGASLTMLMPDYMRHLHRGGIERYVQTGRKHISWEGVELPGLHSSGREIALEVSFGEFVKYGRHYFTGIIRDISERKATERRLAAQYAVTRILSESEDIGEASPAILRSVCESLGWDMGALWYFDSHERHLQCVQTWHSTSADVAEFEKMSRRRTLAPGEGLPGRVWERGEPEWVNDVTTNGNFPRAAAAAQSNLHGAFAFPIRLGNEMLGVMEYFSHDVRQPDRELLEMMSIIGSQIGQFVERRRAESEQTRLREEIISLQEKQLAELSTPLIPITSNIVVMPLIGTVDSKRAQQLLDTLLRGLGASRTPFAIIDITGVPVVDTHVANVLLQASQSARLLGSEVVLTGIRAGVARSLTGLGVGLENLATRKNLQGGIAYAIERLREQNKATGLPLDVHC